MTAIKSTLAKSTQKHRPLSNPATDILHPQDREAMARYRARLTRIDGNWIDKATIIHDIRKRRLYREDWATFEIFCSKELEMTKTNVNRLIQCAAVAKELATIVVSPKRENHFRPLLRLENRSQWLSAYKKAVALATEAGKPLTGTIVARAVQEISNSAVMVPPANTSKADTLTRITRGVTRGLEQLSLEQLEQFETAFEGFKVTWLKTHITPTTSSEVQHSL